MKMQPLMDDYGNSVKDIAVILLIIAGAGTLKEVFVATGVDKNISALLTGIAIDPLVLGWLIAGVIRVSLGSATVAGLTAAGPHGAGGGQRRRRPEPHGAGHRRR